MTPEQLAALEAPIKRGEPSRTPAQLERFLEKRLDFFFPRLTLLKLQAGNPELYAKAFARMTQLDVEARSNNEFNKALEAYRAAQARLARVRLSTGAAAVYEDRETGELDAEGQPITESVLVSPEVPPLVAEDVEYPVFDDEGQQTGTVTEPDRGVTARIEADEAERAAAQAVVDGTSQEVKKWQG